MEKPLCFLEVSLHPMAREALEAVWEITRDPGRIAEASAAVVYTVPDEWTRPGAADGMRAIGAHSCSPAVLRWAGGRGVAITLAEGLWRTVAEHILALMLAAARNIPAADRAIRQGRWAGEKDLKVAFSGRDIQNSTVGIWGMGRIGRELAAMLRGFGCGVIYHDAAPLSAREEEALGAYARPLDALLAESDYLCLLLPLREETRGLVDAAAFRGMKKGVVFVNAARAGIVKEAALLNALDDGAVGAAALDVFWSEGADQPALADRDNVVMTPHLGGSTYECDMSLVRGLL